MDITFGVGDTVVCMDASCNSDLKFGEKYIVTKILDKWEEKRVYIKTASGGEELPNCFYLRRFKKAEPPTPVNYKIGDTVVALKSCRGCGIEADKEYMVVNRHSNGTVDVANAHGQTLEGHLSSMFAPKPVSSPVPQQTTPLKLGQAKVGDILRVVNNAYIEKTLNVGDAVRVNEINLKTAELMVTNDKGVKLPNSFGVFRFVYATPAEIEAYNKSVSVRAEPVTRNGIKKGDYVKVIDNAAGLTKGKAYRVIGVGLAPSVFGDVDTVNCLTNDGQDLGGWRHDRFEKVDGPEVAPNKEPPAKPAVKDIDGTELKVGDKVMLVDTNSLFGGSLNQGDCYKVTGFNLSDVRLEGQYYTWRANRFRKVPDSDTVTPTPEAKPEVKADVPAVAGTKPAEVATAAATAFKVLPKVTTMEAVNSAPGTTFVDAVDEAFRRHFKPSNYVHGLNAIKKATVTFQQQDSFTTATLLLKQHGRLTPVTGVAKRTRTDKENVTAGQAIALNRAIYNALAGYYEPKK